MGLSALHNFQTFRTYKYYQPELYSGSVSAPIWSWQATDLTIGATATFTRASAACALDHDPIYKPVLSGEARFTGARRVRNQATALATHTVTVVVGNLYQVTIKGANTATCVCSGAFTGTLTADGTNRISWPDGTPQAATTTSLSLTITGTLTEVQVENVSGQAVQTPSEYVSVGVLSAPYHGANVDGVKYFAYENGNTVNSSGVVTEAQGAAISAADLSLLMEPVATQLCNYSTACYSLTNTNSVLTNTGTLSIIAGETWTEFRANTAGGTGACTLLSSSAAIPGTSLVAASFILKKGSTGRCNVVTAQYTNNASLAVNLNDGTISPVSNIIDSGIVPLADGAFFVWFTADPGVADRTGTARIQMATDSTGSLTIPLDGTTYLYVGYLGIEADNSTSVIKKVTAAVTRAVDALSYSDIPADNETRFVINGANVDVDDWDGVYSTPTVPERLSSITVYNPGGRPA